MKPVKQGRVQIRKSESPSHSKQYTCGGRGPVVLRQIVDSKYEPGYRQINNHKSMKQSKCFSSLLASYNQHITTVDKITGILRLPLSELFLLANVPLQGTSYSCVN